MGIKVPESKKIVIERSKEYEVCVYKSSWKDEINSLILMLLILLVAYSFAIHDVKIRIFS